MLYCTLHETKPGPDMADSPETWGKIKYYWSKTNKQNKVTINWLEMIFCCTHRSGLYSVIIREAEIEENTETHSQILCRKRDHGRYNPKQDFSFKSLHSEIRQPPIREVGARRTRPSKTTVQSSHEIRETEAAIVGAGSICPRSSAHTL